MEENKYRGGAVNWWPPTGDHVFLYKLNTLRFEYFDSFMESWKEKSVLDVGCGGGYASEHLARRGASVFGTDIMKESLGQARVHAAAENLRIEYRLCTPERLPFDDNTMDAVTCFDVLEHIPDKERILREIGRVLKPGGLFFYDTFSKTFLSKLSIIWIGEIIGRFIPRYTHNWSWFICPEDLKCLLEKNGFNVIEHAGVKRRKKEGEIKRAPVIVTPKGNRSIIYFGAASRTLPAEASLLERPQFQHRFNQEMPCD